MLSLSQADGEAEQQIKAWGGEGNRHFSIQWKSLQVYCTNSVLSLCQRQERAERKVSRGTGSSQ